MQVQHNPIAGCDSGVQPVRVQPFVADPGACHALGLLETLRQRGNVSPPVPAGSRDTRQGDPAALGMLFRLTTLVSGEIAATQPNATAFLARTRKVQWSWVAIRNRDARAGDQLGGQLTGPRLALVLRVRRQETMAAHRWRDGG